MKITIYILFILSIAVTGCFRKKKKVENENGGFCGTMHQPGSNQPAIFKAKCNACHMYNKESTGPKMEDALHRIPNKKWLYSFLRNEDSLTLIKDPYTITLQSNFLLKNCHNNSSLTDAQIQEIINYINQ